MTTLARCMLRAAVAIRMRSFAAGVFAILFAGCALHATRPAVDTATPPDGFPGATYADAAARGEPVFRIDPARSLIVIEVRRAGSLAHLGHDHVVASHDVRGFVAPAEGRSDLYVELDTLVVDEQPLRDAAGFTTHPSDAAVAGTRENMLGRVLRAQEHPFVLISIRRVPGDDHALAVGMTLNGVRRTLRADATIEASGDELRVEGSLPLDQTTFGITPLSILNGAIKVQDRVKIRFDVRARSVAANPLPQAHSAAGEDTG